MRDDAAALLSRPNGSPELPFVVSSLSDLTAPSLFKRWRRSQPLVLRLMDAPQEAADALLADLVPRRQECGCAAAANAALLFMVLASIAVLTMHGWSLASLARAPLVLLGALIAGGVAKGVRLQLARRGMRRAITRFTDSLAKQNYKH
jgi:hypothetical protein